MIGSPSARVPAGRIFSPLPRLNSSLAQEGVLGSGRKFNRIDSLRKDARARPGSHNSILRQKRGKRAAAYSDSKQAFKRKKGVFGSLQHFVLTLVSRPHDSNDVRGNKLTSFVISVCLACAGSFVLGGALISKNKTSGLYGLMSAAFIVFVSSVLNLIHQCTSKSNGFAPIAMTFCTFALLVGLVADGGCALLLSCSVGSLGWLTCGASVYISIGGTMKHCRLAFSVLWGIVLSLFLYEFISLRTTTEVPCPFQRSSVDLTNQVILLRILSTFGSSLIMFSMTMSFVGRTLVEMNKMQKAIESATVLANYVAVMDLEGAEKWLKENKSQKNEEEKDVLQVALASILANLHRFKPFLPDSIFSLHADEEEEVDDESDQEDVEAPSPEMPGQRPPSLDDTASVGSRREATKAKKEHDDAGPSKVKLDLGLHKKKGTFCALTLVRFDTSELEGISSTFVRILFEEIGKSNGTVHKYNGNSAFIYWTSNDGSQHACRALKALTSEIESQMKEFGENIKCISAIHTDRVLLGNVGTDTKRVYHVEGSLVRFVEALALFNAHLNTSILITKNVKDLVVPQYFSAKPVDKLSVRDVDQPRTVTQLIYSLGDEQNVELEEWMYQLEQAERNIANTSDGQYSAAFDKFLAGNYREAEAVFSTVNDPRMAILCKAVSDVPYIRPFGIPWDSFRGELVLHS